MARRTLAEYEGLVTHALGAAPATGITANSIVNDALLHLTTMREWNWRRGGPVLMDLVSGQNYVTLPLDFGGEEVVTYPGSVSRQMIRMTLAELEQLRAFQNNAPGFTYYYAICSGNIDADYPENGLSAATLELFPTPTADATDALSMIYRREVASLDNGTDVPQIPEWMDSAFGFLVRAFAYVYEDENADNAAQAQFDRMFPDLVKRDASFQRRLGVMRGGLLPGAIAVDPLYPNYINDPTSA